MEDTQHLFIPLSFVKEHDESDVLPADNSANEIHLTAYFPESLTLLKPPHLAFIQTLPSIDCTCFVLELFQCNIGFGLYYSYPLR